MACERKRGGFQPAESDAVSAAFDFFRNLFRGNSQGTLYCSRYTACITRWNCGR
jgi:hypothetical protein